MHVPEQTGHSSGVLYLAQCVFGIVCCMVSGRKCGDGVVVYGCTKGVTEKMERLVIWDPDHESESCFGYTVQPASLSSLRTYLGAHDLILVCMISGFHYKVDENCTLLAVMQWEVLIPCRHFRTLLVPSSVVKNSLCNNPEEHSARILVYLWTYWLTVLLSSCVPSDEWVSWLMRKLFVYILWFDKLICDCEKNYTYVHIHAVVLLDMGFREGGQQGILAMMAWPNKHWVRTWSR